MSSVSAGCLASPNSKPRGCMCNRASVLSSTGFLRPHTRHSRYPWNRMHSGAYDPGYFPQIQHQREGRICRLCRPSAGLPDRMYACEGRMTNMLSDAFVPTYRECKSMRKVLRTCVNACSTCRLNSYVCTNGYNGGLLYFFFLYFILCRHSRTSFGSIPLKTCQKRLSSSIFRFWHPSVIEASTNLFACCVFLMRTRMNLRTHKFARTDLKEAYRALALSGQTPSSTRSP